MWQPAPSQAATRSIYLLAESVSDPVLARLALLSLYANYASTPAPSTRCGPFGHDAGATPRSRRLSGFHHARSPARTRTPVPRPSDCPNAAVLKPVLRLLGAADCRCPLWCRRLLLGGSDLGASLASPTHGSHLAQLNARAQSLPLGLIHERPAVDALLLTDDGSFQGKLNPAHTKVAGRWKQAGHAIGVTFKRLKPPRAPGGTGP
jgi:hypothetical protein